MEIKMSLIPGAKNGKVGEISVNLGDKVSSGDILAQVETEKGNRSVKATEAGIIRKIMCEEGDEVVSNQPMFELKREAVEHGTQLSAPQISSIVEDKNVKKLETDLLIIGAGPGGYVAAIFAAKNGLKVTLVEKDELGGTCLNVGCIPTKALVKSAEIYHDIKKSTSFGIKIDGEYQVDMNHIIRRKDKVRKKLVSGIEFLMKKNQIQVLKGHAVFSSNDELTVKGEENYRISFKDLIIATGSRISKVEIPGVDLPFVLNSAEALTCTELPKKITIIGGGVIGMEFAFIYRNLGVEVHVVEFMDRLLSIVDKEVSREIKKIARRSGINVHTNARVTKIQRAADDQAVVSYRDKNGEQLIISDKVLLAIGREPNLEGLNIEKTDIKLNDNGRGIAVSKKMCTNVEHIYAIGDVTDILQLAHVASHQGITAVENILGKSKGVDYSAVPNVIFTIPEISTVGLSEDDCKEMEMDYSVSRVSFRSNGKALTMEQPEGFIKLIKDNSTQRIVGGSIIGADASTLISTLTLGISAELTDAELREIIFAHPTTAEVIHEAAFGLGIGALHQ